jgi:hypothetical protein
MVAVKFHCGVLHRVVQILQHPGNSQHLPAVLFLLRIGEMVPWDKILVSLMKRIGRFTRAPAGEKFLSHPAAVFDFRQSFEMLPNFCLRGNFSGVAVAPERQAFDADVLRGGAVGFLEVFRKALGSVGA